MSEMQAPRVRKLWGKVRSTVAGAIADADDVHTAVQVDPLDEVRGLVEARTAELDASPYAVARTFLVQAVELTELPAGKARATYVKHFYELGHMYRDTWQVNPDLVRERGALGTGRYRDDLGFWFRTNHGWRTETWSLWPRTSRRSEWDLDPVRRPYLAAIALASETVQEIRFLNDIVLQAFDTAALVPVDIDDQLVSITGQLLGAADIREKIGALPVGATAEIIHAQQLWQRHTRELETAAWTPALHRICALIAYRRKLEAVRIQNATIDRIGNSVGIDNAIDALTAESGIDELGSTLLAATTVDLQFAETARSKALAQVRGDYLNAVRV